MDEQLKQIGERLRGLREVLDIPVSEMAETIGISSEKYEKIESGEMDITISNLMKIAKKYGISTEELIFAESAHMKSYFVVRKGQGMSVERTKAYKYQSLVSGFVDHKADVFIVTVEPKPGARTIYKNTHPGQEFNLIPTSFSKGRWSCISEVRPSCSKKVTASTSTPPSPTVCWLLATRPSSFWHLQ